MSKTTTAAEIIAAAHETANEIARVYAAKVRTMRDGAAIAAEQAAAKAAAAARMTGASGDVCSIADIVSEYAAHARADADRATETAKQNAAEAAELKDTDVYAANARAFADTAEYAEARDDPEAARKCADAAREAADNAVASYEYSRHTCYADHQTSAYAARALEIRAEQVEGAKQDADRAEAAAQRAEQATNPEPEQEPAPIYQRYELLAYLGDPDAYDIEAIEAEATAYDPAGRQVWAAFGEDLAAIAEKHELYQYSAI